MLWNIGMNSLWGLFIFHPVTLEILNLQSRGIVLCTRAEQKVRGISS